MKRKEKMEIESYLTKTTFGALKFYALKLFLKVKLKRINKELISLKGKLCLYESAKMKLENNSYELAIQIIDKESDDLLTIERVTEIYPEIRNVIFKPRLSSDFLYLENLRKKLIRLKNTK